MTEREALEYIHSVCWMGSRPGLGRITELCRLMGDPQDSLRFVHVAGTNGKGSFCSMLLEIFSGAGYKVGLFTSPYIEEFGERIRVCGRNIGGDELGEVTEYVKGFADTMDDPPTEFELITAIGFEHFRRERCDIVVLEAGLGGRLDSTNVIATPVLSVITGVDLDHTEILGDTVEKIAAEKAGIIKNGTPILVGDVSESPMEVIRAAAAAAGSPLTACDYGRISSLNASLHGTDFTFAPSGAEHDAGGDYSLSLVGAYQARNAGLVLSAVELLRGVGYSLPREAVVAGLAAARWSARFEVLCREPLAVYDGAHNPQGIRGARENFALFDAAPVLMTGVMADKAHGEMAAALAPLVRHVHTVRPDNPRAMDAAALAAEFAAAGAAAEAHGSLEEGVRCALRDAKESGAPLVMLGSLYMYADAKRLLQEALEEKEDDV